MGLNKYRNMKIKVALIALVLSLGIYGCTTINETGTTSNSSDNIGYKVGQIAPDMELKSIDGTSMKLSDLRGKMVLVDFWASWCKPCRMANPHVVKAYNDYKDKEFKNAKGFTVWGVSLDRGEAGWKKAITEDKLSWETNFLGTQAIAKQYGVRSIPAQFLIDGNGVILATYVGYNPDESFEAELKKLVK